MLTESCYRAFGGVEGALTSHADSVISGMTEVEKKWARVLILRLVTPERTRAIATRRELSEIGGADVANVERVLDKLVDARLLVVENTRSGGSTVELVHESLIDRWPRLGTWLDEADDFAQFRGRLRNAEERTMGALVSLAVLLGATTLVLVRMGTFGKGVSAVGRWGMWLIALLFLLNTVGNLFALDVREAVIFTPVTLLAALLAMRVALGPG